MGNSVSPVSDVRVDKCAKKCHCKLITIVKSINQQ